MDDSIAGATADGLMVRALDALMPENAAAAQGNARTRGLSRALDACATRRQAQGIAKWRSFIDVEAAALPIEDELLSTQRALRRAHAALSSLQGQSR